MTSRERFRCGCLFLVLALPSGPACGRGATAPDDGVPVMRDFGSKIVYGTSRRLKVDRLREHCAGVGGTFNECGTPCAPDAAVCATVCAYTCEGIQR